MTGHLKLDLTRLFSSALGSKGLGAADIDPAAARRAFEAFERRRSSGEVGFAELSRRQDLAKGCSELAEEVRREATDFLHLGIGGSALGPRSLVRALAHPLHNLLSPSRRNGPRIFFVENVDPGSLAGLRDVIDLSRTWVHVASKSGGTVETLSQWLVIREWLESSVGKKEAARRTIFSTDPEKGLLRRIAREQGVRTLEIPANVGGRFSALSPVGLFPLAVAGIDPAGALEGAQAMDERCACGEPEENPALALASALHAFDVRKGRRIHVLMAYADALADTAEWYRQLWAESLGKQSGQEGRETFSGPTPVKAVGAIDQHSQLQLYLEGPEDKVVIFLGVSDLGEEVSVPSREDIPAEAGYLAGHGIGEILEVERRATEESLERHGRPSASILLERLDAAAMGALYQFWGLVTAYAGELYGINAYDQPAVELGKQLARRALEEGAE